MEIEFIPIDYDYFDYEDNNYVKVFGRSKSGKRVCVIDEFEPSFYVILKEGVDKNEISALKDKIMKIEINKGSRTSRVKKVLEEKKSFLEKEYLSLRIFVTNYKDCHDVASEIGDSKIILARREYDIQIITKYIMQGGLKPLFWHELKGELLGEEDYSGLVKNLDVDLCYKSQGYKRIKREDLSVKVLAYDIECEIGELGKSEIWMISLYGKNFKKVLTIKEIKNSQDYVESYNSEKEMLESFVNFVKEYSPDILCGYFSDAFDLPYILERSKKNKMNLSLGLDSSQPKFSRGRLPIGKINGIVHVDLYRFIASVYSQYLSSETLSLNEVAGELIGEKKEDFDFNLIKNMNEDLWKKFFSYNLKDSEITYKLFDKVWADLVEITRIVGEPLFEISRDTMATNVENYILHNLSKFNEIAQKRPSNEEIVNRRSLGKYEGAFVYEPTPGLYEDIVMFDFTSMYGSVIVSYNLSLSTFLGEDKKGDFKFRNEKGFFPTLLEEIINLRKKYKKEFAIKKDNFSRATSNAYKLLANAAYGYLGFFGARYYSREAASSTTKLAKENILSVIEKIKKEGYKILYSDTDSIAFLRGEKTKKQVKDFLKRLNENLPGIMELDLEDFYKRGLFVSKRTVKTGAKKKYALIDEKGVLKIRGFETVRRDWCRLARRLQNEILISVLNEGNEKKAQKILKKVVYDIKNRKIQLDDLMIKTQLKKPILEYASNGPHVVAAKKMKEQKIPVSIGMLIEYYIGEARGKRVGDRVFLPGEERNYDIKYYLNNQVLPAVENIFDVFGINVNEMLDGEKQRGLGDFGS
jgi:DNA polymerase elongation subunit (family B)